MDHHSTPNGLVGGDTLTVPAPRGDVASCLPGCICDHRFGDELGFRMCIAPVATVAVDGHTVSVAVTRIVEDGQVHSTVSLGVDEREPVELRATGPLATGPLVAALTEAGRALQR